MSLSSLTQEKPLPAMPSSAPLLSDMYHIPTSNSSAQPSLLSNSHSEVISSSNTTNYLSSSESSITSSVTNTTTTINPATYSKELAGSFIGTTTQPHSTAPVTLLASTESMNNSGSQPAGIDRLSDELLPTEDEQFAFDEGPVSIYNGSIIINTFDNFFNNDDDSCHTDDDGGGSNYDSDNNNSIVKSHLHATTLSLTKQPYLSSSTSSLNNATTSGGNTLVCRTNTQRRTLHARLAPPRPGSIGFNTSSTSGIIPSPENTSLSIGNTSNPSSNNNNNSGLLPFYSLGERTSRSSSSIGIGSSASASVAAAAAGLPMPSVPYATGTGIYGGYRRRRSSTTSLQSVKSNLGARMSVTLSHGGDAALSLYRETAKRTNDPNLQWEFAKYLLECVEKEEKNNESQDSNTLLSSSNYSATLSGGTTPQAALSVDGSVASLPTNQSGPNSQRNSFASDGLPAITPDNLDQHGYSHSTQTTECRWSSPPSGSISPALRPPSISAGSDIHSPTNTSSQRSLRDEAIYWINKLSKSGHAEACVVKARWHQLGKYNMVQSEDKVTALYTTASKQNHPRAAYRLGGIFEKKKSISKAVQYYMRASSQNDALANLRLGKAHLMGELKLAYDYNLALRYLRRASDAATLADKEAHEAPYLLAQLIGDLHPTIRLPADMLAHDPSGALEQFERAAEFGHTAAMFELAYAYEYACLGLEMAEPDLSIQWYRKAAELGHADAMVGLSGWYLTGLEGILAPDDKLAFDWCYRAANQYGLPKAEYAIGYYYEVGIGVSPDINEAMRWYELAASHGSRDARFRLNKTDGTSGGTKLRKSEYGTVKMKRYKKGRECNVM